MTTNYSGAKYDVPRGLAVAIRTGRCIAFVGAGFAGAAKLPTWPALLRHLAASPQLHKDVCEHLTSRLNANQANHYEEVAQMLQREMGQEAFIAALRQQLCGKKSSAMDNRLELLCGIPFRAVLTTNFDDLLQGTTPCSAAYRQFLHSPPLPPSSLYDNYRRFVSGKHSITMKLHGDLNEPDSIVFSRLDYRKRLYTDPAYLAFLRAVFLNYTILYLGYSFTDAYLNELRSESLAILGSSNNWPTAYAVVNDEPDFARTHFASVEGIEILPYNTNEGGHSGFDAWLQALHQATNPVVGFGNLLKGKRLLWVDSEPKNNSYLKDRFFVDAIKQANKGAKEQSENAQCEIVCVSNAPEALKELHDSLQPAPKLSNELSKQVSNEVPDKPSKYDLIITHWGYKPKQSSTAQELLQQMRQQDIRVPVLIYSTYEHAGERKPVALGLGVQGYYYSTEGLLKAIERVLKPGAEIG